MVIIPIVSIIIDEIFISEKDCWEDDEPNILGKPWILGMDDKRVFKIASGLLEGSSTSSKSLCTS